MKFLKQNIITIIGGIIGGVLGYLYWFNIGCVNGQCMMKSNPYITVFYGMLIIGIISSIINDKFFKKRNSSSS